MLLSLWTGMMPLWVQILCILPTGPMGLVLQIEAGLFLQSQGVQYEMAQALGPVAMEARIIGLPDVPAGEMLPIPPGLCGPARKRATVRSFP